MIRFHVVACTVTAVVLLQTIVVVGQEWELVYEEDFTSSRIQNSILESAEAWKREDYSQSPFDTIMDDKGLFYQNDYGPEFLQALDSFHTQRKEIPLGTDGWLTASLSARDWNKDGILEREPSLSVVQLDGTGKMALRMDASGDHTSGIILRNTRPLPDEYRIEYKLMTLEFGGKRNGTIEYDGTTNGFAPEGPVYPCKTQHPWGEGSGSKGWSGSAGASYCDWQDVVGDVYGYNGFSFLSIVDFPNPAPRNNHFWHYRRKVLIDAFSQHPDRVGTGSGGKVCNPSTNEYYNYTDSSFNVVNMWISGLPETFAPNPGGLTGNSQRFLTTCNGGKATRGLQSAAEMQPELMPYQYYTFALERNTTGYTLEVSGNFARAGFKTIRLHREFEVDDEPIWHYNTNSNEYDGRHNADLKQSNWAFGSSVWPDQWPKGSAYPDSFVIGDPYTNAYEGVASLTDIRYFEPAKKKRCQRAVLMTSRDSIRSGDRLVDATRNLYLDQHVNGNLQLWKVGSNDGPETLLWETQVNGPTNVTYYTELQRDGKLVTSAQDDSTKARSIVWMTERQGQDVNQTYSLTVECEEHGGTLAIHVGPPQTSEEHLWKASGKTGAPTPRPTLSPVANTSLGSNQECNPFVLMKSGDFLYPGKRTIDYERNLHFIQLLDGNVEVRWGSPDYPGDLVWESGYRGDIGSAYYTKLERNGNLVTWKTESNHSFSSVWETSTCRPTLAVYYLVLDCGERRDIVALYEGHPLHGGTRVWGVESRSDPSFQIPIPKPTVPPTLAPSMVPSVYTTKGPSMIPSEETLELSTIVVVGTDPPYSVSSLGAPTASPNSPMKDTSESSAFSIHLVSSLFHLVTFVGLTLQIF